MRRREGEDEQRKDHVGVQASDTILEGFFSSPPPPLRLSTTEHLILPMQRTSASTSSTLSFHCKSKKTNKQTQWLEELLSGLLSFTRPVWLWVFIFIWFYFILSRFTFCSSHERETLTEGKWWIHKHSPSHGKGWFLFGKSWFSLWDVALRDVRLDGEHMFLFLTAGD